MAADDPRANSQAFLHPMTARSHIHAKTWVISIKYKVRNIIFWVDFECYAEIAISEYRSLDNGARRLTLW